ncbi:orf120 [Artaxa digramma nucleopolyhedrovirus]|uniref:Orf120 n=1 Tax=Artaxa digramma nucleopolyhedrovirus TaxID=3070910 RepID=A0AAE6R715_9ABAC|nr:orf120 [Euproctis digramma nucleopolyhedrovirus]QHB21779.1 orf120 [Artaxa digramma nucleopolyhedrovirus]
MLPENQNAWGNRLLDRFSVCFYTNCRRQSFLHMMFVRALGLILAIMLCSHVYFYRSSQYGVKFYLRFSHWAFVLIVLMYTLGLCTSSIEYKFNSQFNALSVSRKLPWHVRLQWIVFNVTITINLLSSVAYYIIVNSCSSIEKFYCAIAEQQPHYGVVYIMSTILVLIELNLSAIPVRLMDIYQVLTYIVSYTIIVETYENYTKVNVYNIKITNDKEAFLVAMCLLVLTVTLYLLTYIVDFIKCKSKKFIVNV